MYISICTATEYTLKTTTVYFAKWLVRWCVCKIHIKKKKNIYIYIYIYFFFFFLFTIFILHSRESELYRNILDGTFVLAWELPFPKFLGPRIFHMKAGRPVKCFCPKDTTSELAGLFSTTSFKCRAPRREAVDTIF